eukprot:TRINITY_DN67804_c9_g2_i2.p1 TRINITY_DN67804_c9_g2~~TRINITY_DN67804_c9_g2_i2.p1  ORF type:complete len:341 (+),score=32.53 TRINITY_DN67804_c9_g2_i2:38-1060(+)
MFRLLAVCCLVITAYSHRHHDQRKEESVSFLSIGDWGGQSAAPYTTPPELACAQTMGKVAKNLNSRFTLALGDNFYGHGIQGNAHDPRFKETFEDVFTASSLQTPWYVIAGNHDHLGNVSAEIAYTKLSSRWRYPEPYYKFTEKAKSADGKHVKLEIIMIDTCDLCGMSYHDEENNVFVEPRGPPNVYAAEKQWEWIEDQLKKSDADYLFAAGHYPIWSVCAHGPTKTLVDRLLPMLKKYNATGFFSGHDHCQEYLEHDGLSFILTGAGHYCCYPGSNMGAVPQGSLKFAVTGDNHGSQIGGFASSTFNASMMTTTYYNAAGKVQYTTPPILPRKKHHHK